MQVTSAEAAKLLRSLREERDALASREKKCRTFAASPEEDPESVRPEYDFVDTRARIEALEAKIRRVRHAVNVFNTVTKVPGFDMTIDEMLVYIPQLSERKALLADMADRLPKERSSSGYGGKALIEYTYANYDVADAAAALARASGELTRAQLALDAVNGSVPMEIDLD